MIAKKHALFITTIILSFHSPAEEWVEVAYFQRQDVKMRIHVYDPPVVLDKWKNKVIGNPHSEAIEKLSTYIDAQTSRDETHFEGWMKLVSREYAEDYLRLIDKSPSEMFNELVDFDFRKHPKHRYESLVWSIDYQVDGETISMLVRAVGEKPLTYFPSDMEAFKKTSWRGVSANFLKFEENRWKFHYLKQKPFKGMEYFSDLERLRAVMEAGYAYHSIDHAGIWPFDPPDTLRNDSVRDRRPGETVFRYPVKKPSVPPPDVPSAVESAGPRSEEEGAKSAPGGSAPPRWVWLLAAYAVLATIFAARGRKR